MKTVGRFCVKSTCVFGLKATVAALWWYLTTGSPTSSSTATDDDAATSKLVQVVVTDSDSRLKPPHIGTDRQSEHYPELQWISLTENFGHEAVSADPTIGGWERSVLQGAFQAILNDVDYYVYVEQDLLVRGHKWIEKCVEVMRQGHDKISYGAATEPRTTVGFGAQPLQQSLVVVSRKYLPTFVQKIVDSKYEIETAADATTRKSAESRWHENFGGT